MWTIPVASFVDLLIPPLEATPRVEIVPEIVETLHFFLGRVNGSQSWDRLCPRETLVQLEDGGKSLEKVGLLILERCQYIDDKNRNIEKIRGT